MYVKNARHTVSIVEKTDVICSIPVWCVKDPQLTVSAARLWVKMDDVQSQKKTADVIDARITVSVAKTPKSRVARD